MIIFDDLSPINNFPDIQMTISQFDNRDCEIGRYTGTFSSILNSIPNFMKYYFRITALGRNDTQGRVCTEHFGVRTTSIGGFELSEESFLNLYLNHEIQVYSKAFTNHHYCAPCFNFSYLLIHDFWYIDKLQTLAQNTREGFINALNQFLKNNPLFCPIENLNSLKETSGIYLMVLDNYNVCYLGQSDDMRKRIMRHWSRNDYFSGTGIDMFKAKDTTRIYAAQVAGRRKINALEHMVVKSFPSRYTLNILAGGDIDYLSMNSAEILKDSCTDSDYINYDLQYHNIAERIHATKDRFIVE